MRVEARKVRAFTLHCDAARTRSHGVRSRNPRCAEGEGDHRGRLCEQHPNSSHPSARNEGPDTLREIECNNWQVIQDRAVIK